jgi:beta-lactamase class C
MHLLKLCAMTICIFAANTYAAATETARVDQHKLKSVVHAAIQPVMQTYNIPGMSVAVTIDGKRFFHHIGVASKNTKQPITNDTLFEIGSISKTFTATLAAYAQVEGKLALSDPVSKHVPNLNRSSFDYITLLNLGTYTAGGLPLQVPNSVSNTDQLMDYFKAWQPAQTPGTSRTYSNPSIGLLGLIAAKSMQESFDDVLEKRLFVSLGMRHSYIKVPENKMKDYAQGYTRDDAPVRMNPGVLASEAYGVKSTAVDMLQFLEANMQVAKVNEKLQAAIVETQRGYFKTIEMEQCLGWERYPYPVMLQQLLAGNGDTMIFDANAVAKLNPSLTQQPNGLFNKTGSTNGFAAYVMFVPAKKIGIVLLANKNYPIAARVKAAYEILMAISP